MQEPNDEAPITDSDVRAKMYRTWMNEWFTNSDNRNKHPLTAEQAARPRSNKTSIFHAHVKNEYGGKHFVMAVWQLGITWAPSQKLLHTNYGGALEHVAKHFASWVRRVAQAVRQHKEKPSTEEARERSGSAWGQHGLSEEQEASRSVKTDFAG